jgi:predicted metalloprotease
VAISLYTSCVVVAGAVLYADCSVAAGADVRVEGFADACRRDEKGVAEDVALEGVASEGIVSKGVLCREDREGERRREEVVASPVRVELRRLRRDTVIISLSSTSVSASLSFVQICCSSS